MRTSATNNYICALYSKRCQKLTLVLSSLLLCGCLDMAIPSELPEVPTSETENLSASFQPPDNLDELFKYQSWFEGTSHFAMEERYGYRNDGMAYGRYEFDNSSNKLSFFAF